MATFLWCLELSDERGQLQKGLPRQYLTGQSREEVSLPLDVVYTPIVVSRQRADTFPYGVGARGDYTCR